MSLRFYMDVHVPLPISLGLRRRGVDVLTSQEDGTEEFDDEQLLQRASDLNRCVFSHDADFLRIVSEWQASSRKFAGVFYSRQRAMRVGEFIDLLALHSECCTVEEVKNVVIYLVP